MTPAICGQAVCGKTICGSVSKVLTSIEIVTPPQKKIYNTNEQFNKEGMSVKAHYNDGTWALLAENQFFCSSLDVSASTVTVSYSENGVTKTAAQDVFVTRPGVSDKQQSVELTRAGTAMLDLYTKNIRFVHADINADALELPFSVSHVYNAKNAESNEASCGYGWQTNFHQRIVSPTSADDADAEYIFIDGSGNRNKIIPLRRTNEDGTTSDVFVLYENQSTEYDPVNRKLTDKDGNFSSFDANGRLKEMVTVDSYRIEIVYSASGKISFVREYENNSSVCNKEFVFSYPASDRMTISFTSANDQRQNSVHFVCSEGRLVKIYYETYGTGQYTSFSYDEKGILISAEDVTGHAVSFSYSGKRVVMTETPGSVVKHPDVTAVVEDTCSARVWKIDYGGNTRVTKDGKTAVLGFSLKNRYAFSFEDQSDGSDVDKLNVVGDIDFAQTIEVEPGQQTYVNILTNTVKKCGSVSVSLPKGLPALGAFAYDLSNNLNMHDPKTVTDKYVDGVSSTRVGGYVAHFSFNRLFADTNVAAKKGYVVSAFVKPNPHSFNCELAAILYDSEGKIVDKAVWEFNHSNPEWQAGAACLDDPQLRGVRIRVMISSSNHNDSWMPMYVDEIRVVEHTFNKSIATEDDPDTPQYYERLKQTFGTGAYTENRYQIANGKVKTNILKSTGVDEFGNPTVQEYEYAQNNGKLEVLYENRRGESIRDKQGEVQSNVIKNEYTYDGYMGALSMHKRHAGGQSVLDANGYQLTKSGMELKLVQTDLWSSNSVETDLRTALVKNSSDRDGNKTIYTYDLRGELTSMALEHAVENQGEATSAPSEPVITDGTSYYYTKFLLTKVVSGNNTVHYVYDGFGKLLQVRLNGTVLKQYAYRDTCNYSAATSESDYNYEEQTIGDYSQKIVYNADGMPVRKQEKSGAGSYSDVVTMNYAAEDGDQYKKGELMSITDVASGSALTQNFTYDAATRKIACVEHEGARSFSISETVSKGGVLTAKTIGFGTDGSLEYNYYYDNVCIGNDFTPAGSCKYMQFQNGQIGWISETQYDSLYNVSARNVYNEGSIPKVCDEYIYNSDKKTIGAVNHYAGANGSPWANEEYTYDDRKNISSYRDVLSGLHTFEYDAAGRLIREENGTSRTTKVFSYNGGNISTVTYYIYTSTGALQESGTLTYNYHGNTDRLASVSTSEGVFWQTNYDSAGNPLHWKGNVLQWNRGRRLVSYGGITFTYDAGGIRQSKTANGVTHSYYTEGSTIHKETLSNGDVLIYGYDESGIASIQYGGAMYYVQKNIQGDVVALVNADGDVVAKYSYDAWGINYVYDAEGKMNASDSFIGNINPFRYRGYYYDRETGLYYLQTRYYDPTAGRFINADSADYLDPESINGLNLYAYCGNNPVMNVDPSGHAWWELGKWDWAKIGMISLSVLEICGGTVIIALTHGAALGIGLGLIGTGIGSIISGLANEDGGGSFFAGWLGSQVGGVIALLPGIGPAIGGFVGSIVTDVAAGESINWGKAWLSGGIGFLLGIPSGIFSEVAAEKDIILQLVNAYNASLISFINILIDYFIGRKRNEKG